ncbi:MAG: hypothetical protein SFV51_04265 [Bryobacteraceae bacterium]|nr:hypothetical protein [Bryobacteraceae bacterium]
MIQPTTFNITTLVLLSLTVWITVIRYRTKLDSNWPLFYYIALVAYARKFEETINPTLVLVAVAMALLLRFEFLEGWILKAIQYTETAILIYVIWRCLELLFGY